MNTSQALEVVKDHFLIRKLRKFTFPRTHPEAWQAVCETTAYMDEWSPDIDERIYHFLHQYTEYPLCPICKDWLSFISLNQGYYETCSQGCHNKQQIFDTNPELILNQDSEEFLKALILQHFTLIKKSKKDFEAWYPLEYKRILDRTSYMDEWEPDFSERCSHVLHNLRDYSTCPQCGNWTNFVRLTVGYTEYCGRACAGKAEASIQKSKETNLERYGATVAANSKEHQEARIQRNLEEYGVEWYTQTAEFQEKFKQTSQERYGVAHPTQLEEVQQRKINTNLERYGVEHATQSAEIRAELKHKYQQKRLEQDSWSDARAYAKTILETCNLINFQERYPNFSLYLNSAFPSIALAEQLFRCANGVMMAPVCQVCGSDVMFKGPVAGYSQFCSIDCANIHSSGLEYKGKDSYSHEFIRELLKIECEDGITFPSGFVSKYPFYKEVMTTYCGDSLEEKVFNFYHNNAKAYTCNCGEPTKFISFKKGYNLFCSPSCASQQTVNQRLTNSGFDLSVYDKLQDFDFLNTEYRIKGKSSLAIAYELGVSGTLVLKSLKAFDIETNRNYSRSSLELRLESWLLDWGIPAEDLIICDRSLGFEIDISIPSLKIGFEIHGLYYHSTAFKKHYWDPTIHQTKYKNARDCGIHLVTLFEDDFLSEDLLKKKLRAILNLETSKIFARKTEIKSVSSLDRSEFLQSNHIQGNGKGHWCKGLYFNDELVALLLMYKDSDTVWKIDRYASSINVVGGFSKLLNCFKREEDYSEIYTFADLRFSKEDSSVYSKTGFSYEYTTSPNYYYVIGNKRHSRMTFMKHKLSKLLVEFDPAKTEEENMRNNGYYRIYDCGNAKYSLKNQSV